MFGTGAISEIIGINIVITGKTGWQGSQLGNGLRRNLALRCITVRDRTAEVRILHDAVTHIDLVDVRFNMETIDRLQHDATADTGGALGLQLGRANALGCRRISGKQAAGTRGETLTALK